MANTKTKSAEPTLSNIVPLIEAARKRAEESAAALTRLEAQLAKGTREDVPVTPAPRRATRDIAGRMAIRPLALHAEPAALATPAGRGAAAAPLPRRVEAVLRSSVASPAEIARRLNEPVVRVTAVLHSLRAKIYNVGTEARPRLSWVPGDRGPTGELNALVERLLRERPHTFAELLEATGARDGRVSGAIVRLQRLDGAKIENLGEPRSAKWYLPE